MNQWSIRRKRLILSIIFFSIVLLIGVPTYLLFYKAPTCFDGRQNGSETGVDCGGSCQLLCNAESLPLISLGDPQITKVRDGVYNVVALLENPNPNGEIYQAEYQLRLYDSSGKNIGVQIVGETFVPRGSRFAIFEGPVEVSNAEPVRAVLEWEEESIVWTRSQSAGALPKVSLKTLSGEDSFPRLDVLLENDSLADISNIDIVAVISDETGSVFAVSKTFLENLPARGSAPVVFTWPEAFQKRVIDVDVLVRVLPDRSFVR